MNPKVASILDKVGKERSKGNHSRALRRLLDGVDKFPDEQQLYRDAVELSLEAGEPLQSVKFLKKALSRFASDRESLWEYAITQVKHFSDPVLAKFLLEQSVKDWKLLSAYRVAKFCDERTTRDLLARIRKKKESMSSALHGGHALSTELAINALSEAILNLRAGRVSEAIRLIVGRMEEDPKTCEEFNPFLSDLEKEFPQKGVVRLAMGSCHLLTGRLDKGVQKVAEAVKMNASLAEEAAEQLEHSFKGVDSPPESLEIALLEIFLAQGNTAKVAELAGSIVKSKPQKTQFILDHLQQSLGREHADWQLEKLYLDISLESGQIQRTLQHLKRNLTDSGDKREQYEWLEHHFKAGNLPAEVMIYFGQNVLGDGRFERAVEILRHTVAKHPADAPTVIKLVENARQKSPVINEFYLEIGGQNDSVQQASGLDIQYFERSEFSLSSYRDAGPDSNPQSDSDLPGSAPATDTNPSAEPPVESPEPEIVSADGLEIDHQPLFKPERQPVPAESPNLSARPEDGVFQRERPPLSEPAGKPVPELELDTAAPAPLEPISEPIPEPGPQPVNEPASEVNMAESSPVPPVPAKQPARDSAEQPAPAERLVQEPAKRPVHVPVESAEKAKATPVAVPDRPPAGTDGKPEMEKEFDRDYRQFLSGKLNNATTLTLIDSALTLGKLKEAETLLTFKPITPEETNRRVLCLAELYIHRNHALPALIALRSIDRQSLSPEDEHLMLRRLASCYRELNMYDAANSVLIDLLNDKPADPVIGRLAKLNFENYLNECCEGTPVIERISVLR